MIGPSVAQGAGSRCPGQLPPTASGSGGAGSALPSTNAFDLDS
jgi:hypothetical protein